MPAAATMTSVAPSTAAGSAMETVPGSDPATSGTEANVQFSGHTQDKATKAKVHLESYYSNLLTQFQVRFLPAIYQYGIISSEISTPRWLPRMF